MTATPSVVSLTKRLVGNEWHRAYEILLNLDGKRDEPNCLKPSHRQRCLDLALSLRLSGRLKSAARLETLTADFSNTDPMLYLLARFARPSKRSSNLGSSVFAFDEASTEQEDCVSRNVFTFNDRSMTSKLTNNTPSIENNDFMLNAARRLLEAERIVRAPVSDEHEQDLPENETTRLPFRKLIPFRDITPSRYVIQSGTGVIQYPRCLIVLLFHLFCSSSNFEKTSVRAPLQSGSPSNFEPTQDESEMVKRRRHHFNSCLSCSKRDAQFVISLILLNRTPFSEYLDTEEQLIKRAKFCGEIHDRLACFSLAYSPSPGRVLLAVAEFAGRVSHDYQRRVLAVVNANGSKTSSSCWEVLYAAEKSIEDAIIVFELLGSIEQTTGSASDILDVLSRALRQYESVKIVEELFYAAFSPYLEMVLDWMLYASSTRDSGREFLGTVLGKKITDSETLFGSDDYVSNRPDAMFPSMLSKETAMFILRSGRSRALLESLSGNHRLLRLPPVPFSFPYSAEKLLALSQWLENSTENLSGSLETDTSVRTEASDVDAILPGSISHEDFSVQKSTEPSISQVFRSPRECDERENVVRSHNLFRVPEVNEEDEKQHLPSTKVVLHPPPRTLFNDVVIESLRAVDSGVQREIFSFFVEKIRVFDHLQLLSDFALLGAGNFADALVDAINIAEKKTRMNERFITRRVNAARTFYGSSGPGVSALRKQRHLAASLRAALHSVGRINDPLTEKFSIGTGGWETTGESSLWNAPFEIEYEASFPLTMIVSADVLSLYSKFFNFFLSVHRARKCLRSLYLRTRRPRSLGHFGSSPKDEKYRRLWIAIWQFSWHADHFVSIVGGYQFNQLHGVARHDMESSCRTITSIWELSELHKNFLEDSIRRVLLGERQQSVMRVIMNAFGQIFQVEADISNLQDDSGNFAKTSWTRLMNKVVSSTEGLKKTSVFLINVLEKLVATGSHPELLDFLTRLNFNKFYSNLRRGNRTVPKVGEEEIVGN